ncbi:MAG: hypothetical protein WC570_02995 [Patescibacteria group bacterium]
MENRFNSAEKKEGNNLQDIPDINYQLFLNSYNIPKDLIDASYKKVEEAFKVGQYVEPECLDDKKEIIHAIAYAIQNKVHPGPIIQMFKEIKEYYQKDIGDLFCGKYNLSKIIEITVNTLKVHGIYQNALAKLKLADNIENMNRDKWKEYADGIRWTQAGRADSIRKEGDHIKANADYLIGDFGFCSKFDMTTDEMYEKLINSPYIKRIDLSCYGVEEEKSYYGPSKSHDWNSYQLQMIQSSISQL